ncbi:MAG TPA: FAD-binding domain-containing protein [Solirubrobacteraceae bacterium]|nr:FAD-binding domain-containing protein [Solirubrobacteraceae bacterium]
MTALVWLTRDLRVRDHPPLRAALDAHDRVVPIFCLDDRLLHGRHASGPRTQFLLDAQHDLDGALRGRGGGLVVRHGPPEEELARLARAAGAAAVYCSADAGPFARARAQRVCAALADAGATLEARSGLFATAPGWPRRVAPCWARRARCRRCPPACARAASRRWTRSAWRPTPPTRRTAARPRRDAAPPRSPPGRPPATRSRPRACRPTCTSAPSRRASSRSASSPTRSAANWPGATSTTTSCSTIRTTRDAPTQPRHRGLRWSRSRRRFDAWCAGQTGFPYVDAGMRQLQREGWMPNRVRPVVGSFLTKDLWLDWREGERWFMRHLVDGDEANNNGNWQWIASVGTDPAPPFRRLYNRARHQERYDPDGRYVRRWVPELARVPAAVLSEPWRMSEEEQEAAGCVIGRDYPEPIVDHAAARREALARFAEARETT